MLTILWFAVAFMYVFLLSLVMVFGVLLAIALAILIVAIFCSFIFGGAV